MTKIKKPPKPLCDLNQWIVWSDKLKGKEGSKSPCDSRGQHPINGIDPKNWMSFEKAKAIAEKNGAITGLGFEFKDGGGLTGIDLDGCRDPSNGWVAPWAQEIVDRFASYVEVSPSGTGLKIWVRGTWPYPGHEAKVPDAPPIPDVDKTAKVEVYSSKRFFAWTGEVYPGPEAAAVSDGDSAMEWLAERYEFTAKAGARLDTVMGKGVRDTQLTSFAGVLRRAGLAPGEIEACLDVINESRGDPPKSGKDIKRIATSVGRYETDPHGALAGGHPKPLGEDAYYGLAGDLVKFLGPRTEASLIALLVTFLVATGSVVGRRLHFGVGAVKHYLNEYALVIGSTAGARKGQSWAEVMQFFDVSEAKFDGSINDENSAVVEMFNWYRERLGGGLSSGEGLIEDLQEHVSNGENRRLVFESEFVRPLTVMKRDGNTLDPILRSAWDDGNLSVMTRGKTRLSVRGAHLSVLAHITESELRKRLTPLHLIDGFANRFLMVWVERAQLLPSPEPLTADELSYWQEKIIDVLKWVNVRGDLRLKRDAEAEALWREKYAYMETRGDSLIDHATARAPAHVMRLSGIYAVLDKSSVIRVEHLRAALALWKYAEESTRYILSGSRLGDTDLDKLDQALSQAGNEGLTRTQIYKLFHRKRTSDEISRMLRELSRMGRAHPVTSQDGDGPATETWFIAQRLLS